MQTDDSTVKVEFQGSEWNTLRKHVERWSKPLDPDDYATPAAVVIQAGEYSSRIRIVGSVGMFSSPVEESISQMPGAFGISRHQLMCIKPKPTEFVRFEAGAGKVIVSMSGSVFEIDRKLVPTPHVRPDKWKGGIDFDASTLAESLITAAKFTADDTDMRRYLQGVSMTRENGVLDICGSNGHYLSFWTKELGGDDFDVIVPKSIVKAFEPRHLKFHFTDDKVMFTSLSDGFELMVDRLNEKSPNFRKTAAYENNDDAWMIVDTDPFINGLKTLGVRQNEAVMVKFGNEGYRLTGKVGKKPKSRNINDEREEMTISLGHREVHGAGQVFVDIKYLNDILKACKSPTVQFSTPVPGDDRGTVIVRPDDKPSLRFLVAPRRK